MKKIQTIIFSFGFILCYAQSVDRNDFVISASPGFTMNYFESTDSNASLWDGETFAGFRSPVNIEYAFSRTVGFSVDFVYTRLHAGTMHASNFNMMDFGAGLRMHTPSNKRMINWFGEVGVHYSRLNYFFHGDFLHETTRAKGYSIYFDLGANIPLSASRKFGMGLSINGDGYRYAKAHYENAYGGSADFSFNGLAMSAGINFYYKL